MLELNIQSRITVEMALDHPWIKVICCISVVGWMISYGESSSVVVFCVKLLQALQTSMHHCTCCHFSDATVPGFCPCAAVHQSQL